MAESDVLIHDLIDVSPADLDITDDLQDDHINTLMMESINGGANHPQVAKSYPSEPVGTIDPRLTTGDMLVLIHSEIYRKKIAGHHLDSMNSFNQVGIKQIACKVYVIEGRMKNLRDGTPEDREIAEVHYRVDITDINLTHPSTTKYKSGTPQLLTPAMARVKNLTYSAQMYIDATITATATLHNGQTRTRHAEIKNHRIASIPCMTGTELCNTYGCSKETLKALGEDPMSIGGAFIIKGGEWTINNLENLCNNTFHVYRNMYQNEIVRGTFLSKAGDAFENSYMVLLRYLNSGLITVEITTIKGERFEIPYYLLFRACGMTRDKDIVNHCVYGVDNGDATTTRMKEILRRCFTIDDGKFSAILQSTQPHEIIEFIARRITDMANSIQARRDDNVTKYINTNILSIIDRYVFPHVGTTQESRVKKMRFLGHLVNRLLAVFMGIVDPTDRDDYKRKRVFAAGTSMAKTFKTDFNFSVVQPIRRQLSNDFRSTPFSQVHLVESFRAAINSDDLEHMLTQAITTGNKTITVKRNEIMNRMASTTLYHKNDLNVKSTLSTIDTPDTSASKQNERADEMRRVHGTYVGYIDISQSADTGEKVGMSKQMGCTTSVCGASSSFVLKVVLKGDADILPLEEVTPEAITARKLAKVFVNGDWVGCCAESHKVAARYRAARRHGHIHHLTTIVWELSTREIYFWTDVGRLMRPLVIVYNNIQEYVNARMQGRTDVEFRQWIKLTHDHIIQLRSRKITMDDLRTARVLEYISPDEQENAYIAPNIDALREVAGDLRHKYTHCDIDQAIFGLVSLASPMANHSNATRITYYTNHRKQSAGWFALNFPHRMDKNVTLQHYCERPLISTFSDSLTYPNGHNLMIGLLIEGGQNQEDSITVNQSSVDCGMFNASYYYYEKAELEKNEQFGNPDYARTMGIKKDAVYEYVHNGFVARGTKLKRDYVMIVKAAKIPKPVDQYTHIDKSIVYTHDEEVYVEQVVTTRNDEDAMFCKVKTRANRPLGVGDKMCLTPDHQVLTDRGWVPIASVTTHHRVACLDPATRKFEFLNPQAVHSYDHSGDMYEVKSQWVNQCVTMNHRMYCMPHGASDYQLIEARHIRGNQVQYLRTGTLNATPEVIMRWYDSYHKLIGDDGVKETFLQHYADNIQIAAFMAGSSANIYMHNDRYPVTDQSQITSDPCAHAESVQYYNGKVHCLTVPTGVFYIRRGGIPSWTGNSSRMGNKGIVANTVPRCDMPYTEEGWIPDALVNPHSVPTRMAVNQLIEQMIGIVAGMMGVHIDATSFRDKDLDEIDRMLRERWGIQYRGHTRTYSGRTGEWKDTLIFIGPTTYQRLEKYVIDDHYATREGPTSAVTRQPLDGKNNSGGLRIGEMESWVFTAAGTNRALHEKFYAHSDGCNIHICRLCGERAIVNEKIGLYKCITHGDIADIVTVSSSWVANLFFNEAEAMNNKITFGVAPHVFSRMDV